MHYNLNQVFIRNHFNLAFEMILNKPGLGWAESYLGWPHGLSWASWSRPPTRCQSNPTFKEEWTFLSITWIEYELREWSKVNFCLIIGIQGELSKCYRRHPAPWYLRSESILIHVTATRHCCKVTATRQLQKTHIASAAFDPRTTVPCLTVKVLIRRSSAPCPCPKPGKDQDQGSRSRSKIKDQDQESGFLCARSKTWQFLVKTESQLVRLSQCSQSHNKQPVERTVGPSSGKVKGNWNRALGSRGKLPSTIVGGKTAIRWFLSVHIYMMSLVGLHIHSVEVKTWPRIAEPLSSHPQGLRTPFCKTIQFSLVITSETKCKENNKSFCYQPVDKGEDNICCAIWGRLGRHQ